MADLSFRDRADAGQQLAVRVAELDLDDPLVLGMPRGGVPVAREVAARIGAALDVVVVRKIGAPDNPEYAVGAIGEDGVEVLHTDALQSLGLTRDDVESTIERERQELARRVSRFRGGGAGEHVEGRTVVLVDDGIATGASAAAAAQTLHQRGASRVVLAVPVAPPRSVDQLRDEVDDVVALATPRGFRAVGAYYHDFAQVTDDEVAAILVDARKGS